MKDKLPIPLYLTLLEIWRNKGRFLVFSMVIALITILILFVSALGEGLSSANRQFIDLIDADLLVLQEKTNLSLQGSRLSKEKLSDIKRISGVSEVGGLAFSNAKLVLSDEGYVDVSLVGISPDGLGAPELISGFSLENSFSNDILIDTEVAKNNNLSIGDFVYLRTVQGAEEQFHKLRISGITEEMQYFFAPSVFVPINTWNEIKPGLSTTPSTDIIFNTVLIKAEDNGNNLNLINRISSLVDGVEVSDKETIVQAQPGYSAQQSTVNAQKGFALLIGMLVLGGFFQIQTVQKIPQIGMLKAIGASNRIVSSAILVQIIVVTILGISMGALATFLLSLGIPSAVPIKFTSEVILISMAVLIIIGPIGGIFSIKMATKVEPLVAMGL
jgi:putative ABC transport system permease protein